MDANGSNGRTAAPDARSSSPEQLVERVQHLTERVAALPDPAARQLADELVGAVIELYGEGLERIFAAIGESGEAQALGDRLVGDGVVASLMLIHDLYPVPLDERVTDALDSVRPYMESHGGNVELLGIERGIARIRLEGSCEDQDGARRRGARPRGPRGRGRGRGDAGHARPGRDRAPGRPGRPWRGGAVGVD